MNRSHTGKPSPLLLVALPVVALLIGVAAGWWFSHDSSVPATDSMESAAPAEPEVLYWYDPMVPNQHFDKPGKSPFMDMDLVPKYADEGGSGDDDGIRIDPRLTQNLGVRTEELSRGQLEDEIDVPFARSGCVMLVHADQNRPHIHLFRLRIIHGRDQG